MSAVVGARTTNGALPATTPATAAASGQLAYDEFLGAMRLFCAWWRDQHPAQPAWVIQARTLPVVEQVVHFARMERALPLDASLAGARCAPSAAASSTSSTAGAAAAAAGAAETWRPEGAPSDEAQACHEPPPPAAAAAQSQQQQQQALHEYSIAWHASYRVPVLYLRGHHPDGQPLALAQLLASLPELRRCYEQAGEQQQQLEQQGAPAEAHAAAAAGAWTFLTPTEHPVTRAPCFMLHPCQTAARMALLLFGCEDEDEDEAVPAPSSQQQQQQLGMGQEEVPGSAAAAPERAPLLLTYARAWFSLVAPLLGLPARGGAATVTPSS